jgi:hypothetical protein
MVIWKPHRTVWMHLRPLVTNETFRKFELSKGLTVKKLDDPVGNMLVEEHLQTTADIVGVLDKLVATAQSPEELQKLLVDFTNERKNFVRQSGRGTVHFKRPDESLWEPL